MNIKEEKNLSATEKAQFIELYKEYFRHFASIPVSNQGIQNKIGNLSISLNAAHYTSQMMDYIEKDERIAFVAFKDSIASGFITGRTYEDNVGWISHFYLKSDLTPLEKKQMTLELYSSLSRKLKEKGMSKVVTEASSYDTAHVDMLEGLAFTEEENLNGEVTYGKHI